MRLAVIKVGDEITGVFITPNQGVDVNVINFSKTLAPWENRIMELIEQSKLEKIA